MRINEIYPRMVGTCSRRRPRTGRTNAARRVVWPNDDARDDALPRPGSGPRAASIERISGPPAVNVGRMRTAQPGRATPTTSCPSRLRAGCLWALGPPSSVCGQSYRPVTTVLRLAKSDMHCRTDGDDLLWVTGSAMWRGCIWKGFGTAALAGRLRSTPVAGTRNTPLVEHWDVIAEYSDSTPSGYTSIDGPTQVTDLDLTNVNKTLVEATIRDVPMEEETRGRLTCRSRRRRTSSTTGKSPTDWGISGPWRSPSTSRLSTTTSHCW